MSAYHSYIHPDWIEAPLEKLRMVEQTWFQQFPTVAIKYGDLVAELNKLKAEMERRTTR